MTGGAVSDALLLLDHDHLSAVRHALANGDPRFGPAMGELEDAAEKVLRLRPPSVLDKVDVPPSGDPHDYLSAAPYWWRDPAQPAVAPYVWRDGRRNPEAQQMGDARAMRRVIDGVSTLGLAWYFSRRRDYAEHAARFVRTWFLDPATRMTPHLSFAQGIPGRSEGRCSGIIETSLLPDLLDGVTLLGPSADLTSDDHLMLREWMRAYLAWLLHSRFGWKESRGGSNHETWYLALVVSLARFVGDDEVVSRVARHARRRMTGQIARDGRQHREVRRALSWHYSIYNLHGWFNVATVGASVGVDLWHHRSWDGRSLRGAVDYVARFASDSGGWPVRDIKGFAPSASHRLLRRAAVAWDEPAYRALAHRVGGGTPRMDLTLP